MVAPWSRGAPASFRGWRGRPWPPSRAGSCGGAAVADDAGRCAGEAAASSNGRRQASRFSSMLTIFVLMVLVSVAASLQGCLTDCDQDSIKECMTTAAPGEFVGKQSCPQLQTMVDCYKPCCADDHPALQASDSAQRIVARYKKVCRKLTNPCK
eukprot:TRINITY_DN29569_c0_g1_i2.p1 TRINITY_DN29569_c0_g1~~TRINITY_DN29569_c0_g1_i2.p1  ORF type:complete len:177 (+),score=21.38 TRINITY_DN29569_c0_g1_i2:70-531(+)